MPTYDKLIYVRKTGVDTNDGLTVDTSVLTIGKAITLATTVGNNRIIVGAGTYSEALSQTVAQDTKMIYIWGDFDGALGTDAGTISIATAANVVVSVQALMQMDNITFSITSTGAIPGFFQNVWSGSAATMTELMGDLTLNNCIINFTCNSNARGIYENKSGVGRKIVLNSVTINPSATTYPYYLSAAASTRMVAAVHNDCVFNGKCDIMLPLTTVDTNNWAQGGGLKVFNNCNFWATVTTGYYFNANNQNPLGGGGIKIVFNGCTFKVSNSIHLFPINVYCLNGTVHTRITVKDCTLKYADNSDLNEFKICQFISVATIHPYDVSGMNSYHGSWTVKDFYAELVNATILYDNNNADGKKCLLLPNHIVLYETTETRNDALVLKFNINNVSYVANNNYNYPVHLIFPFKVTDTNAKTLTIGTKRDTTAATNKYRIVKFDNMYDDYLVSDTITYDTTWADRELAFTPTEVGMYALVLEYPAASALNHYLSKPVIS